MPDEHARGLSTWQHRQKRAFDVALAIVGLVTTSPLMLIGLLLARRDTKESGVFAQTRIGQDGAPFRVYKLRTMRITDHTSTVTTAGDARITSSGRWLRAFKIDELPQLVNVLRGEMSVVGPRPDVPGWADELRGGDRIVLTVPPGITGPASLAFRHEEALLESVPDPDAYNRDVVWPEKVRVNREYVETWSLWRDVCCILATVGSVFHRHKDSAASRR